jgi:hypothetical protein
VDALTPTEIDPGEPAEVSAAIRHARGELERAVHEGGLSRDPMRLPLGALAVTLGALEKLFTATVTQFRVTSQDLDHRLAAILGQANQPADPKMMEQLRTAAARGASQEVLALARAHNWRTTLLAGAVLAGSVLIAGAACYWWGYRAAEARLVDVPAALGAALSGRDATVWLDLMRNNDIERVNRSCASQNGRRACSFLMWTEQMPPPVQLGPR